MGAMDSSDAIMQRFLALHPRKIDLSLGRIETLLARLGHPEERLPPVIHVAGTNGKGSTIAFMRAILEAAGRRVHVYTSPHLVRFHERIRLAGKLVGEEELVAALAACEHANDGAPITIFEITTAAALKLFSETPADYLLLEVGLGGRYDATNVIARPAASVITPVSFDHPEFLGYTIEEIAGEKAGILKRFVPAIIGPQEPEAFAVIERNAMRLGAPLTVAGEDFHVRQEHGRLVYEDMRGLLDLPLPRLVGRHQHQNAATALATLRLVEPDLANAAFERGMVEAEWPARLQRLGKGPLVDLAPRGADLWLDGGHNEAGGRVLAEAAADLEEKSPRPLVLVCGTLATKDTTAFLAAFKGLALEVLAVPLGPEHAGRPAEEVAAAATEAGIPASLAPSVPAALQELGQRDWLVPPRIFITGSLYLAGEVLAENGMVVE
jgi:dihydrofolate synthase/folylpolyglutamate synthase